MKNAVLEPMSAAIPTDTGVRLEPWEQNAHSALHTTTAGWESGLVFMIRRAGLLALFAVSLGFVCVAMVSDQRQRKAADYAQVKLAISQALENATPIREGAIMVQVEARPGQVALGATDGTCGLSE